MNNKTKDFWPIVFRALKGYCPNCGKTRLFKSYIQQVESCSQCGESFGQIRADDGPAWLTILIVGHILAPFILAYGMDTSLPEWASVVLWSVSALILIALILPRAKGLFIAMIWRMQDKSDE